MPVGSRKHTCLVCSKSFVKAEHLQRHQRIHTGVKPFSCDQCKQKFTRLDSLTRHQQKSGHHNSGVTESPIPSQPSDADIEIDARLPQRDALSNEQLIAQTAELEQHEFTEDSFMHLTWPDSEALLQSILNADVSAWPQNFENLPSQHLPQVNYGTVDVASPWLTNSTSDTSANGTNAVHSISQIISAHSMSLASEAESASLSTAYLEGCLHAFFEQMTTVLPICHRPTFVFRDWTHPLLLNAIALGSLFMGQDIDVAKGEVLWTLAHTAVATSWHSLILHRGPYDSCDGVQLVTTALLGQTFAMLSGTSKLRSTAQIFHSLGFYWARKCGMYNKAIPNFVDELAISVSYEQKFEIWKRWAAEELQLRALLGHYILDGQLTYFTGAPTCQRHTSNLLLFPCSDQLFRAESLSEWMALLHTERRGRETFQEIFTQLFTSPASLTFKSCRFSLLALQVILEGLQSLVTDLNHAGCQVVGAPSPDAIEQALYGMQRPMQEIEYMSHGEKMQLQLRWHTICIDKAINFSHICQTLCTRLDIQQHVFGNVNANIQNVNLPIWTRSRSARTALLHAAEIRSILSALPIQSTYAIHISTALFAATIVYTAFVAGGMTNMSLPAISDWSSLSQTSTTLDHGVEQFLMEPRPAAGTLAVRNLLYDVNSFLLLSNQLRRPWVICVDIASILHQICKKCGA